MPADGETIGEIAVSGNDVMLGYYRDEEATREVTRSGCFLTGDLAVRHPDGYVEIRDRSKDIIISGGENIASVEVERVLDSHPSVVESAVIGVPDERWGEVPVAFVALREETSTRTRWPTTPGSGWPGTRYPSASSSVTCPRRPRARSRRMSCVSGQGTRRGFMSDPDIPVLERFSLAGKVALVTGASSGLGAGFAVALAQAGADVVLAARRRDGLEATSREVEKLGRCALAGGGRCHRPGRVPGGGAGGRRAVRPPGRARQQRRDGHRGTRAARDPGAVPPGHRRQPAGRLLDGPGGRAGHAARLEPSSTSPACSAWSSPSRRRRPTRPARPASSG